MQYTNTFQSAPRVPVTPIAGAASAVVTGGQAVEVFPPGSIRYGAKITNQGSSPMFISAAATATLVWGSANDVILGGETWRWEGPITTAVSLNCAVPASFTAYSW